MVFRISLLWLLFVHTIAAQTLPISKVSNQVLRKLTYQGSCDIMVKFLPQADLSLAINLRDKNAKADYVWSQSSRIAAQTQEGVQAWASSRHLNIRQYYIVNAIAISKASLADIEDLARFYPIDYIYDDSWVKQPLPDAKGNENEKSMPPQITWGILNIKADSVWRLGHNGQGVVIGGQDTGVDWLHPAIKNQYRGWNGTTADHNYNWHDAIHTLDTSRHNRCGVNLTTPCDDYDHGTHTMGTMVGDSSMKFGVAPAARWIACRNMDVGAGKPSTYIECFEFFLAPTDTANQNPNPALGADIINNSWGCPLSEGCDSANIVLMGSVVSNMKTAGKIVVASAGNEGPACSSMDSPAAIFGDVFTIGAGNMIDSVTGFSNRGPILIDNSFRQKPDIIAPGFMVYSCIPNNNYIQISGTSMAAPHTCGSIALLLSAFPSLGGQVDSIENILKITARHHTDTLSCGAIAGSSIPNNTYGYGNLDIYAAIKRQRTLLSSSPVITEENNSNTFWISPNPAHNEIIVHIPAPDNSRLSLLTSDGRMIRSWQASSVYSQFSISDLPEGLYFIGVQSEKEICFKKLVISR